MPCISCIICAFNEAERIENILQAVTGHPDLLEIIVVNDGSTDDTDALLRTRKDIQLISYAQNKGKAHALSKGIAAARGELVMLLDADLSGVNAENISLLAAPVLQGKADVSISLRKNSLWLYQLVEFDFVSGERVVPKSFIAETIGFMETLPRWGAETYMNKLIVKHEMRVAIVDWQNVYNVRKYVKVGRYEGMLEELRMIRDSFATVSVLNNIMQNAALLRCKIPKEN